MIFFDINIAIRNAFRSPRRSILMVLGVAFATALMVLTVGFTEGQHNRTIYYQSSLLTGFVQIQHEDYFEDNSPENYVEHAGVLLQRLDQLEPFKNIDIRAVERFNAGALISNEDASRGIQIMGVDWQREQNFGGIASTIQKNSGIKPDLGQLLLGYELADALSVEVGDEVVIVGFTTAGSLNPMLFSVAATFDSGMQAFDRNIVLMGISDVRSLVDVQDGASEIVLMAPHMKYTDQLASLANAVLSGIEGQGLAVHRWEKLNSQLFDFLRLDSAMAYLMLIVMILIVSVSAANGLLLSQLERTRESGLMLSIGVLPHRLFAMTLIEGVFLVSMGTFVGSLMGYGAVWWFVENPIVIAGLEDITRLYGMEAVMPTEFNILVTIYTPFSMWLICLFSLLIISLRVLYLKPLEALRYTT